MSWIIFKIDNKRLLFHHKTFNGHIMIYEITSFLKIPFRISIAVLITTLGLFAPRAVDATVRGKADIGFVGVKTKILTSGKTTKDMYLYGIGGNATLFFMENFCWCPSWLTALCFKPSFVTVSGDSDNGELWNLGLGVGYCLPVMSCVSVTPTAGITFGELDARVDIPQYALSNVKEQFQSRTPYVGVDVTVNFSDCWMLSLMYQYGWARTKTHIYDFIEQISESSGSNYSAILDYYITSCWSVNIGGAYNLSRSKEKHGIEVIGGRIGVGYTF